MIIGISGKKQHGKDTTAKMLQYIFADEVASDFQLEELLETTSLPKGIYTTWEIHRFADKLKDIVCLLIGCTRQQLEDPIFKETPLKKEWNKNNTKMTPRLLLQLLGTEAGREVIHRNIWVNATMADYIPTMYSVTVDPVADFHLDMNRYPNWIIPDVRFLNEVQAIKERNGILIRINRPIESSDRHLSEIALDNYTGWDYVINNDKDLFGLMQTIRETFKNVNLEPFKGTIY